MGSTSQNKRPGLSPQDYGSYLEQRRILMEAEQDFAKSFDRWLLTLAGGALGLSIAFLKDIAGPQQAAGVGWLVAAWILLGLSVSVVLMSMLVSQRGHETFRRVLDEEASVGGEGFLSRAKKAQQRRWEPHVIAWLNRAGIATFLAGIITLAKFAIVNL